MRGSPVDDDALVCDVLSEAARLKVENRLDVRLDVTWKTSLSVNKALLMIQARCQKKTMRKSRHDQHKQGAFCTAWVRRFVPS